MDPALIEAFVSSILGADADYTKGNRFFDLREIKSMPLLRRIGNLGLSFMAKASTGYWDLFDPTNGYTAIHAEVARRLPYDSISSRYFFESDILFRLNVMRAKVLDVPMDARYGDEISGLKVSKIVGEFLAKHVQYQQANHLRLLSARHEHCLVRASGCRADDRFGVAFGLYHWIGSVEGGLITPLGTIMLAALPLVLGVQLLLAFLSHDTAAMPRHACIASCCAIRRRARRPTECDAVAAVPARALARRSGTPCRGKLIARVLGNDRHHQDRAMNQHQHRHKRYAPITGAPPRNYGQQAQRDQERSGAPKASQLRLQQGLAHPVGRVRQHGCLRRSAQPRLHPLQILLFADLEAEDIEIQWPRGPVAPDHSAGTKHVVKFDIRPFQGHAEPDPEQVILMLHGRRNIIMIMKMVVFTIEQRYRQSLAPLSTASSIALSSADSGFCPAARCADRWWVYAM